MKKFLFGAAAGSAAVLLVHTAVSLVGEYAARCRLDAAIEVATLNLREPFVTVESVDRPADWPSYYNVIRVTYRLADGQLKARLCVPLDDSLPERGDRVRFTHGNKFMGLPRVGPGIRPAGGPK